eukprot:NODE_213_length_12556_cov_0.937063.p8 type:complete len:247 gc:universal NODE_213_length_12556_cov_0.937063:3110-3850(+)
MTDSILSIQSQVIHGCVGNQAASHVAHILDTQISCIPTAIFSNHKGHKFYTQNSIDLESLIDGLRQNGFMKFTKVIVGYLGTLDVAKIIFNLIIEIKALNPKCLLIIDPVMGDNDRLYVQKDLVEFYRCTLCPLADIITPNDFESNLLSDMKSGPIVITTSRIVSNDTLSLICTLKDKSFSFNFPRIDGWFCGTGDIFSSIIACKIKDLNINDLEITCKYAVNCLHNILMDNLHTKDLKLKLNHFQ